MKFATIHNFTEQNRYRISTTRIPTCYYYLLNPKLHSINLNLHARRPFRLPKSRNSAGLTNIWRPQSSNNPHGHSSIMSLAKSHVATTSASPAITIKPTSTEIAVIRAASSRGMITSASTGIILNVIADSQVVRTERVENALVCLKKGFGSALLELVDTIPTGGMGCRMRRQRCGSSLGPNCWREYRPLVKIDF